MAAVICKPDETIKRFINGLWAVYKANAEEQPTLLEDHLKDLAQLQTKYADTEAVSIYLFVHSDYYILIG